MVFEFSLSVGFGLVVKNAASVHLFHSLLISLNLRHQCFFSDSATQCLTRKTNTLQPPSMWSCAAR